MNVSTSSLAPELQKPYEPGAAAPSVLSIDQSARQAEARDAWQQIIDYKLVEWGRDPSLLEEDDLLPPTPIAVQQAIELARTLQSGSEPPPSRVVPDRDGGIVFELSTGCETINLLISSNGEIERLLWCGAKIVKSQQIR